MTLLHETTTLGPPAAEGTERARADGQWVDVCALDDLDVDRGAGALVAGAPVAIFRCSPGDVLYAIGNIDPYSAASVLSRGIVGSAGDRPIVVSPVFKNRFDLRTGASLDDPAVSVPVHAVRCVGGRVAIAAPTL